MLESLLWSGAMRPDDRTSIRELAEQHGVSAMPVREAVSRLVAQGALAAERNRAIVVPRLTAEEFSDLTEMRILTESHAVRKATPRITPAIMSELRALSHAFAEAMTSPGTDEAVMLNQKLHFSIYTASESRTLMQMISTNWLRAGPMISLDIGLPTRRMRNAHSVRAHAAMLDAIEARDADAASAALRSDIQTTADYILREVLRAKET